MSIYRSDSLAFIGFGQYLCDIAQELNRQFPGDVEMPMHWSNLQAFDEYDHLAHIYRLCRVHGFRWIKLVDSPEHIRDAMRHLFCYCSQTWDKDVALIKSHPVGQGENINLE